MIQRIFHPVGQGAFYSERHEQQNINIVYDCGTEYINRNKKCMKNVVTHSFSKNDVINILFISHFDYDHISLINTLMNAVKKIEYVVIPLLHDEEIKFISNIYNALGENNLGILVSDLNQYFGEDIHIIRVKPSNEERIEQIEPILLRNEDQVIPSGTPIQIDSSYDWCFIPFNYEYTTRNKEFIKELQNKNIDIDKLKNDINYIVERKKDIRDIYKKVAGNINQNSMFLYSGPLSRRCYRSIRGWHGNCPHLYFLPYNDFFSDKVACLYTGDGDLNITNIKTYYEKFWELIGTIQIPHHGSLASFHQNILKDQKLLCPISVGKNNSYGHPSQKVIGSILSHECYPILVTEHVDSTFIEIIWNKYGCPF